MKQMLFDLNVWHPRLERLAAPEYYRQRTINISGPFSLECYRRVMEEAVDKKLLKYSFSRECLIWGQGEPFDPAQTKIGGSPYRSRKKAWPKGISGEPIPFFAQFNFSSCARSRTRDYEFLVTFADINYGEVTEFAYEWYQLDDIDLAPVAPPPGTVPWPSQVLYSELAPLPLYVLEGSVEKFKRDCHRYGFSTDALRFPKASLIFPWDGVPSESGDLKLVASIDFIRPNFNCEWTWLSGPEREIGYYDENGGPIGFDYREDHRPNRWLETDHFGTFYFYVDCLGKVNLECSQFLPYIQQPFSRG